MKLCVLGQRALVVLSTALSSGCAPPTPAAPARSASVKHHAAPVVTAAAVPACARGTEVWLPGAQQRLSLCDTTLELRRASDNQVQTQKDVSTLDGAGGPNRLAVSPDGTRVALTGYGNVDLRELPSLNLLWSAVARPMSVQFSPDGRQVLLGEDGNTVAFSLADGQRVPVAPTHIAQRWQGSRELSADGTLAVEALPDKLTVWDAHKDVALQTIERPKGSYGTPTWIGPYLGFRVSGDHLLVDARNPQRRFTLEGLDSLAQTSLSRDETRLRFSRNGVVAEWRLGESQPTVLASHNPQSIWLGPGGVQVESTDSALTVWRPSTGGELVAQRYWANPEWVEIGPAGQVVALDNRQARLLVLSAAGEQELKLEPGERPSLLAFEPSGTRFATFAQGKLRVYRQQPLGVEQTIELPDSPSFIAWRAEAPELLLIRNEHLYSLALSGGVVSPFGDSTQVQRVAVSPNGKDMAVVTGAVGKLQLLLPNHGDVPPQPLAAAPEDMRFSQDGKTLWLVSQDELLTLRLPPAPGVPLRAERKPINAHRYRTRLSPLGGVYSTNARVYFDLDSSEMLSVVEPAAATPQWSEQGLTLNFAHNPPVVISLPTGVAVFQSRPQTPAKAAPIPQFPLLSSDVRAWATNRDGSVLATLDSTATVTTFSKTGALLARLTESAGTLISSEDASSLVIVSSDARTLTVWDTQTWQPRVELPATDGVQRVAVSKDGTRVAVLTGSGAVLVVSADRSLRRYELRTDIAISGLAFDPTGQYLALGGMPIRILRLADRAVLYGYAAPSQGRPVAPLAWLSEAGAGAISGDWRLLGQFALPGSPREGAVHGTLSKRQSPHLVESFFSN